MEMVPPNHKVHILGARILNGGEPKTIEQYDPTLRIKARAFAEFPNNCPSNKQLYMDSKQPLFH